MPQHRIAWDQKNPTPEMYWEFQYQDLGSDQWNWVLSTDPASSCYTCFETLVEVPVTAAAIRSRSAEGGLFSDWSNAITLPEPPVSVALTAAIAMTLVAHRFRTKSSKTNQSAEPQSRPSSLNR